MVRANKLPTTRAASATTTLIASTAVRSLRMGAKAAAEYLDDDRFLMLEEALEISYDRLDEVIDEYKKLARSWKEFIERRRSDENIDC